MMSFIFFSLIFFADKKIILGVLFIIITSFTHRSGVAFLLVMLTVHFYLIIIKKIINRNINYFIYGFIFNFFI